MIETKTVFRPVVITKLKARSLKDREVETAAQIAMETAVKEDAKIHGFSEGYVISIFQAKDVKEVIPQ